MTTWPATLPSSPQINSLSGGPEDSVLRTKNDVGPMVMRNRFTGVCYRYQFSLLMTLAQVNILNAFFRDDLGNGALPFDFPDPVFGDTKEFSFIQVYTIQSIAAIDNYIITMAIVSDAL